jgi:hypothetical protein
MVKRFVGPILYALLQSGELRISVKAVKNGVFFLNLLIQNLKRGHAEVGTPEETYVHSWCWSSKKTQPLFLVNHLYCLSCRFKKRTQKKHLLFTEIKHLKTLFHQQLHDFTSSICKSTFYSFGLTVVEEALLVVSTKQLLILFWIINTRN